MTHPYSILIFSSNIRGKNGLVSWPLDFTLNKTGQFHLLHYITHYIESSQGVPSL